MNIAIMADIHGNHIALEACIGEARKLGAEEFLFLGDYLGELAYPERTIKQLERIRKPMTVSPHNFRVNCRKPYRNLLHY